MGALCPGLEITQGGGSDHLARRAEPGVPGQTDGVHGTVSARTGDQFFDRSHPIRGATCIPESEHSWIIESIDQIV